VPRVLNHHPLPVNLSYVPPPSAQQAVAMMPSQVIVGQQVLPSIDPSRFNPPRQVPDYHGGEYMEQRPSYTPPPVVMEQRPSYTPPPVLTMGQHVQMGVPGGQPTEPALMASTAKVCPQHIVQQLQQQQQHGLVIGQTPSYVPPPVQVIQNSPSYMPPVLGQPQGDAAATSVQMPAVVPTQQGPSITTLPSHEHMLAQGAAVGLAPMHPQQVLQPMMAPCGQPHMVPTQMVLPTMGFPTIGMMPSAPPSSLGLVAHGALANGNFMQPAGSLGVVPQGALPQQGMPPSMLGAAPQMQQQLMSGQIGAFPQMPGQQLSGQLHPGIGAPFPSVVQGMEAQHMAMAMASPMTHPSAGVL